jgi:hypothetical protein
MTSTSDTGTGTGSTPPPAGHVLVRFTAAVHAAADRVAEAPGWSMTEAEAAAAVVGLTRLEARVGELRLRALAAADAADVAKGDASSSTGAWLAGATRQRRAGAAADVRFAAALDGEFEATRAALAGGEVLVEQARVVVAAVQALPAGLDAATRRRAEAHMLELAGEFDAKELARLGRHLFEVLDPAEAERRLGEKLEREERESARKTFLSMRDNGDGTVTGKFKISAFTAAQLTRGLSALMTRRHHAATAAARMMHPDRHPLGADDWQHPAGRPGHPGNEEAEAEAAEAERERQRLLSRPERLGQAFAAYITRFPADRLPRLGGVNATVVVTMTMEQLVEGVRGACMLDTGEHVSAAMARQLACEAGVIPAVLGSDSQVLDLGRLVRFHTGAQRLALGLRDRGCTAEGCARPAWACEAHHKTPWSQGGLTTVDDGILLCPWHHHRAHDPRYRVDYLPSGKTRFHRRT